MSSFFQVLRGRCFFSCWLEHFELGTRAVTTLIPCSITHPSYHDNMQSSVVDFVHGGGVRGFRGSDLKQCTFADNADIMPKDIMPKDNSRLLSFSHLHTHSLAVYVGHFELAYMTLMFAHHLSGV